MAKSKYIIGAVTLVALSSALTYWFAPEKVKIKEVEKIVKIKGETKIVHRDVIKEKIVKPDGTVIEREVDKSRESEEKNETVAKVKEKKKEITRSKRNWLIEGGTILDGTSLTGSGFYGSIHRRIIGEIYAGATITTDKQVLVGVTIRF